MDIDIRQPQPGTPAWQQALALRRAVLRAPLGLDFSATDLAQEQGDLLFAAYAGGTLAGVVMLRPQFDGIARLRQMAVVDGLRGHGIGDRLLAAFEARAREADFHRIELAARAPARGFYERHGYVAHGAEFIEVTIPHIHMSKPLPPR